jgi:hypothetical protein
LYFEKFMRYLQHIGKLKPQNKPVISNSLGDGFQ